MPFTALVSDPSTPHFVKNQPSSDKINFLYKVVKAKLSTISFGVNAQKYKVKTRSARFSVNLSTKDLLPICRVR